MILLLGLRCAFPGSSLADRTQTTPARGAIPPDQKPSRASFRAAEAHAPQAAASGGNPSSRSRSRGRGRPMGTSACSGSAPGRAVRGSRWRQCCPRNPFPRRSAGGPGRSGPLSPNGCDCSRSSRPSENTAPLAEAEEAGVLVSDRGYIRFVHPLLSSVVYGSASSARRRAPAPRLAEVGLRRNEGAISRRVPRDPTNSSRRIEHTARQAAIRGRAGCGSGAVRGGRLANTGRASEGRVSRSWVRSALLARVTSGRSIARKRGGESRPCLTARGGAYHTRRNRMAYPGAERPMSYSSRRWPG